VGEEEKVKSSEQLSVSSDCRPRIGHECSNGREIDSCIRGKFVDGFVLRRKGEKEASSDWRAMKL
jgi:hypothetical protein